jgi:4-hydroxy-3-methylbut-2-en-1-yl diphosphate reductase
MMKIEVDHNSGYCFGVEYAIELAEHELKQSGKLYCLGNIVHNDREVSRLQAKGLVVIDHSQMEKLSDCKVLIRAHGEPPSTYITALKNNIELIDASCPIVLKLQNRIKLSGEELNNEGQIVILGNPGHAEVIGLMGQTGGKGIVISSVEDLDKIDFSRPIHFYSQTTKSIDLYAEVKQAIQKRMLASGNDGFNANDTICRQVSNRNPKLREFANQFDVIVFVAGRQSSNGKALFKVCKDTNPKSYFISSSEELKASWFENVESVGICGATSTPSWLMNEVARHIGKLPKLIGS